MKFKERILNCLLRTFLFSRYRFRFSFDANFDPDRQDPYLLIGNHSCLMDGQFTVLPLDRYPFPVINSFMYRKPFMRFLLTQLIRSIPKRKGQSDILTIRMIMDTIKKENRGVLLFPEAMPPISEKRV
jgi:1-acyl-sn-glycerol-3-phosphate acyltransferase